MAAAAAPGQPASVAEKLRVYSGSCRALGISPAAEVVAALKANSDQICLGGSRDRRCSPAHWLALVELLLSDYAGSPLTANWTSCGDVPPGEADQLLGPSAAKHSLPWTPVRRLRMAHHDAAGLNGGVLLKRLLLVCDTLEELELDRTELAASDAEALADGLAANTTLRVLTMHGNHLGEKGGRALARALLANRDQCALEHVDLSNNAVGFAGVKALQEAAAVVNEGRKSSGRPPLVLQTSQNYHAEELANAVTHAIPALFAIFGTFRILSRTWERSERLFLSTLVFCCCLLTCFISSTLYHSFFMLRRTRMVFRVLDHCAIYLLIAGTFTPIVLMHFQDWSGSPWLLAFQWMATALGITLNCFNAEEDADAPPSKIELALYLGMGWSALTMLPQLALVQWEMQRLVYLGGFFYTAGVWFFIRGDTHWPMWHAVWHVFVAAGALSHFLAIYWYTVEVHLPGENLDWHLPGQPLAAAQMRQLQDIAASMAAQSGVPALRMPVGPPNLEFIREFFINLTHDLLWRIHLINDTLHSGGGAAGAAAAGAAPPAAAQP